MKTSKNTEFDLFGQEHAITNAFKMMIASFDKGGKLLVCGNGGSAADCEHIVGELMKGFYLDRKLDNNQQNQFLNERCSTSYDLVEKLQNGLPAISLVSHSSLITAINNDIGGDMIFAQQIWSLGKAGDILLAISTSGNSVNILKAAKVAIAKKIAVIGLTGIDGGRLAVLCDELISAPSNDVAEIQEMHLPIYHAICKKLEMHYFSV